MPHEYYVDILDDGARRILVYTDDADAIEKIGKPDVIYSKGGKAAGWHYVVMFGSPEQQKIFQELNLTKKHEVKSRGRGGR